MNPSIRRSLINTGTRIICNPHLWFILLIFSSLIFIYYFATFPYNTRLNWFQPLVDFELAYHMNGSLFIILLLYVALVFRQRGALTTWLVSMVVMLPRVVFLSFTTMHLILNIFYAALPALVLLLITLKLKWREKERKMMAEREAERNSYTAQIFKAQEDERKRIAQELHDDTTQTLLVVAGNARSIINKGYFTDNSDARENIEWIIDTIVRLAEDMRRLSLDLRPSVLDNMGLLSALRWLVDRLSNESGIDTRIVVKGRNRRLQTDKEVVIFRLVQEALNNVRHHSHATTACLTLEFVSDSLRIIVQDNGQGFSLPEMIDSFTAEGKLGLIGMKERVQFLNGVLNIHSEPGKGTSILVEVKC